MKKSLHFIFIFSLLFMSGPALAANNFNTSNSNTDQAKEDYRAYLEQLKALSQQYKQVTGEIQKVMADEGIPVWDDNAGGIFVSKVPMPASVNQVFGDTDIQETDKEIIVKVDLPGVDKDAIKVSLADDNTLRISGERQELKGSQGQQNGAYYYKAERQQGSFERQIKLPAPAQNTGMQAKYENGVLAVTVLKALDAKKETPIPVQ